MKKQKQKGPLSLPSSSSSSSSREVECLRTWLVDRGARLDAIRAGLASGNGLGLYATREIKAGEEIAAVPFDCTVTEAVARKTEAGRGFADFLEGGRYRETWGAAEREMGLCPPIMTPCEATVFVFLMVERAKGATSSWASYLQSLPSRYDDPLWWTDGEMQEIAGTNLGNTVALQLRALREVYVEGIFREFYEKCKPKGMAAPGFTLEKLRWAYSAYRSRAFPRALIDISTATESTSSGLDVKELPARRVGCMLPFLDLGNHAYGQKITWRLERGYVCFIAGDTIPNRAQIFNNYGAKSNESLLLSYGFALESNPQDEFKVRLGGGNPNSIATLDHYLSIDEPPPESLIKAVAQLTSPAWADEAPGAELNHRIRSLAAIQKSIKSRIEGLERAESKWKLKPTGNRDSARIPQRGRAAIIYRDGQLRVLQSSLKETTVMLRSHAKSLMKLMPRIDQDKVAKALDRCEKHAKILKKNGIMSFLANIDGRIVATKSIARNSAVVSCPLSSMLTEQKIRQDARFTLLLQLVAGIDAETVMVLFILFSCRSGKGLWSKVLHEWVKNKPGTADKSTQQLFRDLFPALSEYSPEIFPTVVCTWENFDAAVRLVDGLAVRLVLKGREVTCVLPLATPIPTFLEAGGLASNRITPSKPGNDCRYEIYSLSDIEIGSVLP